MISGVIEVHQCVIVVSELAFQAACMCMVIAGGNVHKTAVRHGNTSDCCAPL